MATQKKLPTADTGPQLQCYTVSGKHFVISQNPMTGKFTLWRVDKGYEKIATASNPTILSEKVPWDS